MNDKPLDGPPRIPAPDRPYDPPPVYEELRANRPLCPVKLSDGSSALLATSYDAVRSVLGDRRFSGDVTRPGFPIEGHIGGRVDVFAKSLIRRDEPEHSRLRKVVANEFRPARIEELAGMMREIVDDCLVDVRKAARPVDLVALFTLEVPSRIICRFLGIDETIRPEIKRLALSAGEKSVPHQKHALEKLADKLSDHLSAMRADADSQQLFPKLLAAVERSEITREELVSMAVLLALGGHETTANTLALGISRILCDRELYDKLVREPDQLPGAVEEIVRITSVVRAGPRRVAVDDVEVCGRQIPKGTGVILALHSANYDQKFTSDPETFQIGRERARSHMAFGFGLHQCLGQFLARQELLIALQALLSGFKNLRLETPTQNLEFHGEAGIYGLKELRVSWSE